jgi:hypothetical protein
MGVTHFESHGRTTISCDYGNEVNIKADRVARAETGEVTILIRTTVDGVRHLTVLNEDGSLRAHVSDGTWSQLYQRAGLDVVQVEGKPKARYPRSARDRLEASDIGPAYRDRSSD